MKKLADKRVENPKYYLNIIIQQNPEFEVPDCRQQVKFIILHPTS
jgi:hypothetical protein